MNGKRFLVLAAMVLLAGCGSASDFVKPIDTFAEATATSEEALSNIDKQMAAELQAMRRAEALAEKHRVAAGENQCLSTFGTEPDPNQPPGCEVRLKSKIAGEAPEDLTLTTIMPNQMILVHEMGLYAKSLADITKADETPQVKAGVDAALAAASTLSTVLAPQASPAITSFSPPVSAAVVWIFGQYQDQVKLNALREATAKMDPVLQAVVEKLRGSASLAGAVDQDRLVLKYQAKRAAFQDSPTPTATALEEMLAAAAELDAVLKSQPQEVFEQMAVAHGALTKALIAKDISFANAWKQIEAFVAKAKELAKIVESFEEAAKLN